MPASHDVLGEDRQAASTTSTTTSTTSTTSSTTSTTSSTTRTTSTIGTTSTTSTGPPLNKNTLRRSGLRQCSYLGVSFVKNGQGKNHECF